MNIEDIKKSFNNICVSADIWHPDDMKLVNELIFKLEQAEKALEFYSNQKHWTTAYYHNEFGKAQVKAMYKSNPWEKAEEALQAIRKGD